MKHSDKKLIDNHLAVFLRANGDNLQDIRDRLEQTEPTTRRRDHLSALDRIAVLAELPLASIPTSGPGLRQAFAKMDKAAGRPSLKTVRNLKSATLGAIRRFGRNTSSLTQRIPLSAAWEQMLGRIHDNERQYGMRRLARYCSATGIDPTSVCKEHLFGFYEAVRAESVLKDPRKTLSQAISVWNWCVKNVLGWPSHRLSSPFPSTRYRLPLEAFPTSFQNDLANWSRKRTDTDEFLFDGPTQKQRRVTMEGKILGVLRFASLQIARGVVPIEEIRGLRDIVVPKRVKAGLVALKARDAGTTYLRHTATLMLEIARHHCCLPDDELEELRSYLRHLPRQRGMTSKNIEWLKQFDSEDNIEILFEHSAKSRRSAMRQTNQIRRAKGMELALVFEIFLWTGLRMQNVRTIRIKDNIRWRRGECILTFEPWEMKSNRPFETVLQGDVAKALKDFLANHRPKLPGSAGPYLFAGPSGGPKHQSTIARRIKLSMKKAGLDISPHFLRHTGAELVIADDPSRVGIVSQRLGHASTEITRTYYLRSPSKGASRVMNALLDDAVEKSRRTRKRPPP